MVELPYDSWSSSISRRVHRVCWTDVLAEMYSASHVLSEIVYFFCEAHELVVP